jgi:hypothetical protein
MDDGEVCRKGLPWVEDGLLSCTRTRLLNRVEPVTGRALSLVSVDVLVQIRPDLRFRLTAPHHTHIFAFARTVVYLY